MHLPDITEYYVNETNEVPHNQYKRTFVVEIEVLGYCEICGTVLNSETDIYTYNNYLFCREEHKKEYMDMEKDGEI